MESTGLYTYYLWNKSIYTPSNCHVFGDSTYVLDHKIQNSDVNEYPYKLAAKK